jgi:glycosyltransferase involved in cell wall biosynthesis
MTQVTQLGIGWEVGSPSGWGTYGTNLAMELVRLGIAPAIFLHGGKVTLLPQQSTLLAAPFAKHKEWYAAAQRGPLALDFPMLHSFADGFAPSGRLETVRGSPNAAVVFFETAVFTPEELVRARSFDLIIAGSNWNAEVLRAHQLPNIRYCPQGVDTSIFKPGPRRGSFGDRFTVFSGGKAEYRKGQDIVIAAFKRFHARRPDALLVTAWHSPWPKVAAGFASSPHLQAAAEVGADGRLDVAGWLLANGLPENSFVDVGPQANAATPLLMREIDLAVFPNRCEGGTNLVAMECMASGIPVVLSRNTGHRDLITADNCYPLDRQSSCGATPELAGWGESAVDEVVERMEQAYTDRAAARLRGASAARFMQDWNWGAQTRRLLDALGV